MALNAFTADGQVEKQMGMKKKVVSARNGIPYMQGGDKSYPSPEYAPDFYKDCPGQPGAFTRP